MIVVVAEATLHVTFEFSGWFLRHQHHITARGVAAEQGALWSFQHLDILQIEKEARTSAITAGDQHRRGAGRNDVGKVGADRRRCPGLLVETADRITGAIRSKS